MNDKTDKLRSFRFVRGISRVFEPKKNSGLLQVPHYKEFLHGLLIFMARSNNILLISIIILSTIFNYLSPYHLRCFLIPVWFNMILQMILVLARIFKSRKTIKNSFEDQILRGIILDPGYEVIQSDNIQTGDFIRLQRNQVAPCDMLVIDTDERNLSDYVATVETSCYNGDSKLSVKKALNGTKMVSSKTSFGGILKGDFTQYRKKLSGSISYSLPETPYEDFKAYTTLRNDPKIEEATYENLIVKGSLLKSGWMIGLVLYVGSDSKGGGS